jgi:hypothetical protein
VPMAGAGSPAATPAAGASAPGCIETEVTNHNMIGTLTMESAGLLALLLQQVNAGGQRGGCAPSPQPQALQQPYRQQR